MVASRVGGKRPHAAKSPGATTTSWDLEKVDVQADPTAISGKADTAGRDERRRRPVRCTGVLAAARTQGKRAQHGKPQSAVRDDQPDAREGEAGRYGVAERLVVCAGQRVSQGGGSPLGARMRSAVSESGGNASLAGKARRYGEA